MKILLLGTSQGLGKEIARSLALSEKHKQTEVVTISSLDEVKPGEGDILIVDDANTSIVSKKSIAVCGHLSENLGVRAFPEAITDRSCDKGMQHWRGGSRGKGGKIKYQRK